MKPWLRTKTPEQCEAEAALLGLTYFRASHTYGRIVEGPSDEIDKHRCAETMHQLPRHLTIKRAWEYMDTEGSNPGG